MNRGIAESRPGRGLSPWLVLSLIGGLSFWAVAVFDPALPLGVRIAWKGAGVALLAVHAALHSRGRSAHWPAQWIAIVMVFGALGDMVLEVEQAAGAALFLVGHWLAVVLYWRYREPRPSTGLRAAAGAVVFGVTLLGANLPGDQATGATVGFYAFGLGMMAATALLSRFPRDHLALGALLFVASDLLIFARMGPLAGSALPRLAIWPLYYFGQVLVTLGVLRGARPG